MSTPNQSRVRQKQRRVTIHDVADRAAVSIATVSRVVNGSEKVDAELAERVRAAISELQYQPSRAARTLAGSQSGIIGLLNTDIQNPFFMEIIRGVEDVAQRSGYLVVLCNSSEDPGRERRYIEVLCAEPVAGVIIVPTSDRKSVLRPFAENGIPVVALDRRVPDHTIDTVVIDNVAAAREAVGHLIANGYRRIGLIVGPDSASTARERREGYRMALGEAGIALDNSLEHSGPYTEASARHLAEMLLEIRPPIDALFTGNNRLTRGALEVLYARGLRVPEDIAIVGFDEVPWSLPGAPSLSCVIQPAYELGFTAATRLINRLQNPDTAARQEIILAYQFRVGDTSRPRASIGSATAT